MNIDEQGYCECDNPEWWNGGWAIGLVRCKNCGGLKKWVEKKSQVLLDSFVKYCNDHPEERFWQALRNWCGWSFILASNKFDIELADKVWGTPGLSMQDTFYWEENKKYEKS